MIWTKWRRRDNAWPSAWRRNCCETSEIVFNEDHASLDIELLKHIDIEELDEEVNVDLAVLKTFFDSEYDQEFEDGQADDDNEVDHAETAQEKVDEMEIDPAESMFFADGKLCSSLLNETSDYFSEDSTHPYWTLWTWEWRTIYHIYIVN